ncbi:MAG: ABC transporter ATP-binding protein [Verrucomicrobiaceae bacterium]|nr:ABC transporter ATP-binding protein [Verrucomicrobiaceae bacterium]
MAILNIRNAGKSFGFGALKQDILSNLNLSINEGEFLAIVGPSGVGKTTLINLLVGLLQPDTGSVEFEGKPITGPSQERALVFQTYALLPWFTVKQNVLLAVSQVHRHLSRAEQSAHADRYIEMVNLSHASFKRPSELSGGMRQRVSVARALAMNPKVLLLDEPLGALDALTRATLQDEFVNIWKTARTTMVLVTNDPEEALLTADRVIPLRPGPPSTLGPEFLVPFDRPRRDPAIRESAEFIDLRVQITDYLRASMPRLSADDEAYAFPDLSPPPVVKPTGWRAKVRKLLAHFPEESDPT